MVVAMVKSEEDDDNKYTDNDTEDGDSVDNDDDGDTYDASDNHRSIVAIVIIVVLHIRKVNNDDMREYCNIPAAADATKIWCFVERLSDTSPNSINDDNDDDDDDGDDVNDDDYIMTTIVMMMVVIAMTMTLIMI